MARSKIHYQHIIQRHMLEFGFICAEDIQDALGLPKDALTRTRVQDALRQAVKRLRVDGWNIRTVAKMDGGGFELTSNPRTGAAIHRK